jgi:hypothetical protein
MLQSPIYSVVLPRLAIFPGAKAAKIPDAKLAILASSAFRAEFLMADPGRPAPRCARNPASGC